MNATTVPGPVTPGGFHNPIMDDEDARKLRDVLTFRDLCEYFKRSPNATRRIIRELGVRPTPWTEDARVKTYLRRDLYEAVDGGGKKTAPLHHRRKATRRAAR
jgi:hypothetical protein